MAILGGQSKVTPEMRKQAEDLGIKLAVFMAAEHPSIDMVVSVAFACWNDIDQAHVTEDYMRFVLLMYDAFQGEGGTLRSEE